MFCGHLRVLLGVTLDMHLTEHSVMRGDANRVAHRSGQGLDQERTGRLCWVAAGEHASGVRVEQPSLWIESMARDGVVWSV
jgi:hypothetical protein